MIFSPQSFTVNDICSFIRASPSHSSISSIQAMLYCLNFWTLIISFVAAFTGIFCYYNLQIPVSFPLLEVSAPHKDVSPHHASWNTWFHPFRSHSWSSDTDQKKGWDLLYHLGGIGPWVEKVDGEGISPPEGCSIDQVHLLSRHAERYPTKSAADRHLSLLKRLKEANVALNGSLAFINDWTYFSKKLAHLTTEGPYAGILQAFTTGVRFRTRYGHLLPNNTKTRFWASDSVRVIQTAKYFASGLFGLDWESDGLAELQVIPETFERGADTLTPGDSCPRYLADTEFGHPSGLSALILFQETYVPALAKRLEEHNPEVGPFTNMEVYGMQEMCGFETIARGASPWCDVFRREDWENFDYARDVLKYYKAGPGNPYAGAMGWLWLNATTSLLRSGPEAGTIFLSFAHDGDIAPFLAALDIFKDPKYDPKLPTTHIAKDRVWRTSSVLPMGGRVTLERMTCSSSSNSETDDRETFVRISMNDRVMPLPHCQAGPGSSCSLEQFVNHVQRRRVEVGEFKEVCGWEGDAGRISFLHQD